jgi:hypothetical protein
MRPTVAIFPVDEAQVGIQRAVSVGTSLVTVFGLFAVGARLVCNCSKREATGSSLGLAACSVTQAERSTHGVVVALWRTVPATMLVSHRLGRGVDVDRLFGLVARHVVGVQIFLGIEMRAADDAVVLVCVCHEKPPMANGTALVVPGTSLRRSYRR